MKQDPRNTKKNIKYRIKEIAIRNGKPTDFPYRVYKKIPFLPIYMEVNYFKTLKSAVEYKSGKIIEDEALKIKYKKKPRWISAEEEFVEKI